MGRYDFVSGGFEGSNAIQKFLVERALQQRQASMDAFAQQRVQEEAKQKAADLELRTGQERRIADAQKAQIEDLANERAFRRETTFAENAMPGDVIDESKQAALEKQGYGGQVKKVPGIMAPLLGSAASSDAQVSPDSFQMRGGSKYLSARAAADEREAAAKEAQAAREATAKEQRDFQASQNDLNRQNTRAIAGAVNARVTNQQDQARADKEQARTDAQTAAATGRSEVRDLAQSLLSDPALEGITGGFMGRRDTFFEGSAIDAKRRLDQLVGKLSLESRGKMKGQGQISDYEGRLLSNAVSAIDRAAGPEVVKKHLQEIVDAFSGDAPRAEPNTNSGGGGAPTTGGGFRVVRKH